MAGMVVPGYQQYQGNNQGVTGGRLPGINTGNYPTGATAPYGNAVEGGANKTAAGNAADTGANYAVDTTGATMYNNEGEQGRMTDAARARLVAEADARRFAMMQGLRGGGNSPNIGTVQYDPTGSGEAAKAAAFARAKDQSGKIAASQLRSLYENMAERGLGGSPIGNPGVQDIMSGAAQPLNDLTREQMIQDFNDINDRSKTVYQGNITQRGQDYNNQAANLQALQSLFSLFNGPAY